MIELFLIFGTVQPSTAAECAFKAHSNNSDSAATSNKCIALWLIGFLQFLLQLKVLFHSLSSFTDSRYCLSEFPKQLELR